MVNFPLEPDVRTQVDERLKNLGWILSGSKKNVFLEQPKTEDEKRKLQGKRPDYVLYEKGKDKPLIVIETKKPGTNIGLALIQGKQYAQVLNAPIVFATDGVFYKSLHTETEKPLLLNGEEVDELIREFTAIQYLQADSNALDTIPKEIQLSRQELINIFDEANNNLRVEGLRAGIERFSEFANILFLKLFTEIDDQRPQPVFDRKLKWDFYKSKPADEILYYINDTVLPKISKYYKDENIFSPLQIKDGKVLKKIITKLDPLILTDINSDIKGDAFEYFLKATTATGNDLGEYFTPRHVVKMMVKLVNPQIGEKIYDPFCGTGGLLIESYRHIYNTMPRNERTIKQLRNETIFGNEITNTARITKMNMILAGDGHSNIQMKNSLADPADIESKFDVVLTNMPYSQTTEFGSLYDVPTKNGDSICVQHCIKAIDKTSDNGRIAIVVPEGFLFRKDLKKTREYMLEKCHLQSIVSLPQGVFLPYTGVKTNVLYLTKIGKKVKQNNIWYFEITNDGFTLDNNRRKKEGSNDIDKFLENRKIDGISKKEALNVGFHLIPYDKIEQNDYVLSAARYMESQSISYKWGSKKIKDIAEVTNGFAFSSDFFSENQGVPIVRVRDVNSGRPSIRYKGKFKEEYLIANGDIIIGMDGEFNATVWVGGEALLNQRVCKIGNFKDCLPKYVYWLIQKQLKQIEFNTPFTTVKHISAKQIENIEIPFPPIEMQQTLVDELENYNRIIDGTLAISNNYYAKIIINPEWNVVNILEVMDFITGLTLSIPNSEDKNGVPIISMNSITEEGYIVTHGIRKIKLPKNRMINYLQKGDLLFNWRNGSKHLVGKTGFFEFEGKYVFASFLLGLRPKQNIINPRYLWVLLNQFRREGLYRKLMRVQINGLYNRDELSQLKIPLPPLAEQNSIVKNIQNELQIVHANKQLLEIFREKIAEKINQMWGN